ncbi:TPA: hypothetical protein MJE60_15900 [Klebsiella pneumoniae]|nr:hypothetical protein EMH47_23545 [Klebsiella pneumoniae]HBZ0924944.1 hypothetical protein [Klebsiella pneumoniae]HBZ1355733.1 hypothetical protein [Klebsiella pneumoniae]
MRRHAEPFRYFSNRIAPLGDLADGLFLKFRGKTWCAHRLLLCSNYRADLSTGSGSLHFVNMAFDALSKVSLFDFYRVLIV